MKSIMYHYVREFDAKHPNFRFLDVKNFKKQLDYFKDNFGFVSKEEWDQFINNGKLPDRKRKVLLTFDDAMRCNYDYVYPELMKRGLWGIFYVPVLPYQQQKLLDVHRIHLLCGAFAGEDLFREALSRITNEMIPDSKKKEFKEKTYNNQINYAGVTEFKRLLNYYISYNYRETFIDSLGEVFSYRFDASKFYVQKEELQQMFNDGMIIGSHGVNHPLMSKLSELEQRKQIVSSFTTLENFGVIGQKTYCHPYGGFHSFNHNTITLLIKEGVSYSFNVEARDIEAKDYLQSIQFLPRYDCNLFEHGKAS